MSDKEYVDRIILIDNHALSIRRRDNYGALCDHCGWSILTRSELDFPDRTDKTIADKDPVVCICGETIDCEFCSQQLQWRIDEDLENSSFQRGRAEGFPLGVDWTQFSSDGTKKIAYTMCKHLHPQGPFPRPPQTANIWWNTIIQQSKDVDGYDSEYFNRLISCFEVFHKCGLIIGAVQVGTYLSWHLSQEGFLESALLVLELIDSHASENLSGREQETHTLEIQSLKLYLDTRKSISLEKQLDFDSINQDVIRISEEAFEKSISESGIATFLARVTELVNQNQE